MGEGQSACVSTAPQSLQKEKSWEIKKEEPGFQTGTARLCVSKQSAYSFFFFLFCEAHTLEGVLCWSRPLPPRMGKQPPS